MARDYLREFLGEFIEEALQGGERDSYLDNTKITLEADGHLTVAKEYPTGTEVYDIKVSRRNPARRR